LIPIGCASENGLESTMKSAPIKKIDDPYKYFIAKKKLLVCHHLRRKNEKVGKNEIVTISVLLG